MTPSIALTFAVTGVALALFVSHRVRTDVAGLIVMTALIALGLVSPREGISGFASEATITVALMLVLSTGLIRTGVIDVLGRRMAHMTGQSELRLLLLVLGVTIPFSAVVNNTAAVAVLLPLLLGLSRANRLAPSRILMPLSFASQMGGTLTLIGTSTNLLAAAIALDVGLGRIGLFDITPPALVLGLIGVVYLLTIGRWLTPVRSAPQNVMESYELREYLTAVIVVPGSPLVGRSLAESRFGDKHRLHVVQVHRGDARILAPTGGTVLEAADVLVVTGAVSDIAQIEQSEHLRIAGTKPELQGGGTESGSRWTEVLVPLGSRLIGRTLRELDFRRRHGVTALAIQRHGHALHAPAARLPMEAGDLLLVQGSPQALRELHETGDLALLGPVRVPATRRRKAARAIAIMAGVVVLPAVGATTILVSALLGVVAMLLTGCITAEEAYTEMDWSVIILLATILPLGIAMRDSGAAAWAAQELAELAAPLGATGTLAAFYLLATLLTSLISNNAAVIVLLPVAIATAATLGLSPMPFLIGIMIAASNSFATPVGYQTNLMIYGPGGYRFGDFLKVGGLLNLLMTLAAPFVIPLFFPF